MSDFPAYPEYSADACVLSTFAASVSADSITGVIDAALAAGFRVGKHADPIEGVREDLTRDEAVAVAHENPSLLYLARS